MTVRLHQYPSIQAPPGVDDLASFKSAPMITNTCEIDSTLTARLRLEFKMRPSNSCKAHYIFPTFGSVAFLLFDIELISLYCKRFEEAVKKIHDMRETFRHCFVLVLLTSSAAETFRTFARLQFRFPSKPGFIPCRSIDDCVNFIKTLCVAHQPESISKKFELFTQIQEEAASAEAATEVLVNNITELQPLDCLMLQQALGGIGAIAQTNVADVIENTPLEIEKAQALTEFFQEDKSLIV